MCARLRAAIFLNAVRMREAISMSHGPLMSPENLRKLQEGCYLFRSALNSGLVA